MNSTLRPHTPCTAALGMIRRTLRTSPEETGGGCPKLMHGRLRGRIPKALHTTELDNMSTNNLRGGNLERLSLTLHVLSLEQHISCDFDN